MAVIFYFDGSFYKRGIDDGRLRVALETPEIDAIVYDPEVPGDTDNSIGTEVNMNNDADIFCGLAVGDEIMIGLVPDAVLVRGLWSLTYRGVEGLNGTIDLVKCQDVIDDIDSGGDGSGLAAYIGTLTPALDKNLGHPPCAGEVVGQLPWNSNAGYAGTTVRDPSAFTSVVVDPIFLNLREACYIRLTITAIPDYSSEETACCTECTKVEYPHFSVGVIYDRTCADKLRWLRYCNCANTGLCNDPCDEPYTEQSAPVIP